LIFRGRESRRGQGAAIAVLFAAALLAVVLIEGCGPPKKSTRVVRMGVLRNDLHQLAYFVARQKGFFAEQGIEVKEVEASTGGPEEMGAFSAGDLDMGYVGIASVATFVGQGMADVKIVAQANAEGSAAVVRNGMEAEDVAGLKGRNVAVPGYYTVQDYLLRIALKKAGVSDKEVNISVLTPAKMPAALAAATVDAAVIWESYPSMIEAQKVGRVLITSAEVWPHHPCCMLVADSAFLRNNPGTVRKVVAAHVKAMNYIRDNPLEASDMAQLFTGQPKQVAHAAMKNVEFSFRPSLNGIARYVEFLKENGVIKVKDPAGFAASLVDNGFIR
jgi:NitT/TauT family transport system substrate-binding protein